MITRRKALVGSAFGLMAAPFGLSALGELQADSLEALERRSGGRLGVFITDTGSGRSIGHRADERFSMCSTFKMPLAAVILREADAGRLDLATAVPFTRADIVTYSPVTEPALAQGSMTIAALAEAAQVQGDNTAANLLLPLIGGPEGFTAILRSLGDTETRLDRFETELNLGPPGELRDTTTPAAMAGLMTTLLTGDALSEPSRQRMIEWMVATGTGRARIRAGLPAGWRAGDKTGSGIAPVMSNKYNDIAIVWPPGGSPLIVTAYFEGPGYFDDLRDEDQAVLAEVGRIAADWIRPA